MNYLKRNTNNFLILIIVLCSVGYCQNTIYVNDCKLFTRVDRFKDSSNVLSHSLVTSLDSLKIRKNLNWKDCNTELNERLNNYLRSYLRNENDALDSLPYSVWDLCETLKMDYLVVLYIFYDNDDITSSIVNSHLFPLHDRFSKEDLSDEDINYFYNVFRIKDNRSMISFDEDLDDLMENNPDKSPDGIAKKFMKIIEKRYLPKAR